MVPNICTYVFLLEEDAQGDLILIIPRPPSSCSETGLIKDKVSSRRMINWLRTLMCARRSLTRIWALCLFAVTQRILIQLDLPGVRTKSEKWDCQCPFIYLFFLFVCEREENIFLEYFGVVWRCEIGHVCRYWQQFKCLDGKQLSSSIDTWHRHLSVILILNMFPFWLRTDSIAALPRPNSGNIVYKSNCIVLPQRRGGIEFRLHSTATSRNKSWRIIDITGTSKKSNLVEFVLPHLSID